MTRRYSSSLRSVGQVRISPHRPWAMFTAVALVWSAQGTAWACGAPAGDAHYLYPHDGSTEVATNAKLIGQYQNPSAYWLRKLGPTTTPPGDASAETLDAQANPLVASDGGTTLEIPLTADCTRSSKLCILTATLEPNTAYAWGSGQTTYPQTFTTGSGERSPAPLPSVEARVLDVDWSAGRGECGAAEPFTISAEFQASSEPWILVAGSKGDEPVLISTDDTSLVWAAVEFVDCMRLTQVNWAGEAFDAGLAICPPARPTDADAPDEPSSSSSSTSTTTHGSTERDGNDASPEPTDGDGNDASPEPTDGNSNDTSFGTADDTGRSQWRSEAPAAEKYSDCNCRLGGKTSPSAAAGLGLLVAGLLSRRRNRLTGRR